MARPGPRSTNHAEQMKTVVRPISASRTPQARTPAVAEDDFGNDSSEHDQDDDRRDGQLQAVQPRRGDEGKE